MRLEMDTSTWLNFHEVVAAMIRKKTKINSKGKQKKSARAVSKRVKSAPKKKAKTKTNVAKKALKRKTAGKSSGSKRRSARKKSAARRDEEFAQNLRGRNRTSSGRSSGAQTGDFQGLSRVQEADSESVDELVEEGNPFEAGAVAGVEEADNADEREVHTHEVAEDDVPEEYLEKD